MATKITPEALIEMGFEESDNRFVLSYPYIIVYKSDWKVLLDFNITNASTMEDINDLIRLFK
jgi:hypothetical protein